MESFQDPTIDPIMESVQDPIMESVQDLVMESVQNPIMESVQDPIMESDPEITGYLISVDPIMLKSVQDSNGIRQICPSRC